MINIRSEEDMSPEAVLGEMTPEQAAQVPSLNSSEAPGHMSIYGLRKGVTKTI